MYFGDVMQEEMLAERKGVTAISPYLGINEVVCSHHWHHDIRILSLALRAQVDRSRGDLTSLLPDGFSS